MFYVLYGYVLGYVVLYFCVMYVLCGYIFDYVGISYVFGSVEEF